MVEYSGDGPLRLDVATAGVYRARIGEVTIGWITHDDVGWVATIGTDLASSVWVGRRFALPDAAELLIPG